MRVYQTLLIMMALSLAVSACSFSQGREAAERAVENFHRQFNEGQCAEIYAHSGEGFRKVTTGEEMLALCDGLRSKLGTVKSSTQGGWHVNLTHEGSVVTLSYNTEFTNGTAMEKFVWVVNGEEAKLFQYNITSPLLTDK